MDVSANGSVSAQDNGEGWYTFAGFMFLVAGVANALWAWAAFESKAYLPEDSLLVSNLKFWAWVSVGASLIALVGAGLLLTRARGAALYGCLAATLSAVFWLFALPVLPIWALVIIGIDAMIIYGLTTVAEGGRTTHGMRADGDGGAVSQAEATTAVEGGRQKAKAAR